MQKAASEMTGETILAASVVATPGAVKKEIVNLGAFGAVGGAVAGALAGGEQAASISSSPGGTWVCSTWR